MNATDRKLIRSLMIVATVLVSLMVGGILWAALTNPPAPQPAAPEGGGVVR